MPKIVSVPFAVQKGSAGIAQNSAETLCNMYAEMPISGRSPIIRRQRACLRSVYTQAGEKRCIERHKGVHYTVIASTFSSFDGTTLTPLGTLSTSTGRCTMIFNDLDEIMIADGTYGYYWNGATLAVVTTDPAMNVGTLAYLGGYGVANDAGSGRFYSTVANDFSDFDVLDFATAEANPDPLYRVFADHSELWLAGERTIEIWTLSGQADFPFLSQPTAKIERGIAAKFSMASEDNTVIWLGDDKVVYRGDGYRPNRMSTDAVEYSIQQVSANGVANAYAMLHTIGGKKFYTLTFPGELTVQYNFATGLWNEASTYGSDSFDVIGSAGKYTDYYMTPAGICELTDDVNQDEGGIVVRLARSAPGSASGYNIAIHEFFADCEVGRAPIGVTAEVMLRVALDGETFTNILTRSLGLTGDYARRAIWEGLGQGRKPVLELSASGNFRFVIMDTGINASVCNS
jgi:hypothetical protein